MDVLRHQHAYRDDSVRCGREWQQGAVNSTEESRDEEDDDFDLTPETIAAWEREAATAGGWLPHRLRFEAQVLVVVLFWLLGGWVYSLLNDDWSYAESVYYASNVGFSIGFGAPWRPPTKAALLS